MSIALREELTSTNHSTFRMVATRQPPSPNRSHSRISPRVRPNFLATKAGMVVRTDVLPGLAVETAVRSVAVRM